MPDLSLSAVEPRKNKRVNTVSMGLATHTFNFMGLDTVVFQSLLAQDPARALSLTLS